MERYDGVAALETVRKVLSVKFAYKTQPEQRRYGFIAQELGNYVPDLISVVSGLGIEKRLVLNEAGMVPVLWAAVRVLTTEVENVKNKK